MEGSSTLLHVFVSILLGILGFAFFAAFNTWWTRNKSDLKTRDPRPMFQVIFRVLALSGCTVAIILFVRELLPYQIARTSGILQADGLLPIMAIDGYEGQLADNKGIIKEGEPIITYDRKLGPTEEAEARLERDLIIEQIAGMKARLKQGNPIDELQQLSQVQRLLAARDEAEQERSRAQLEVESLKYKLDAQRARVSLARKEVDFARDAITSGLVSQIEFDRRQETLRMEQARFYELKSRLDFSLGSLPEEQPDGESQGLRRIDQVLQTDLTSNGDTNDSAVISLERKLSELNRLLSGEFRTPIVLSAPWAGVMGYRNPASKPAPDQLIGVLVRYDALFLEVLIPSSLADQIGDGAHVRISNEKLEELRVTLRGEVRRAIPENKQQTRLEVRLTQRSDLIKDLATGKENTLTVDFINEPPRFAREVALFFRDISPRDLALLFTAVFLWLMVIYRRRGKNESSAVDQQKGKTDGE